MNPAPLPAPTETAAPSRLRPFRIGPYELANNLILAPMAGISDRPYRALCRRFGAGLAVAEMVSANTALWGSRKSLRRLDYRNEEGPVAAQIVGADPAEMAEAARVNLGLGAHIIDINMGCPAKKVCKVAAGSALLRDEVLVGRILDAVVRAVDAPVTLKIRTGWSPQTRNAVEIARIARECGIAALTVHGRTRACHYGIPAEFDTIRAIHDRVAIPLIANGDIASAEHARRVLDSTGAGAIMIGRAAQGRPWIFRDIAAGLASGNAQSETGIEWNQLDERTSSSERTSPILLIRDVLREHLEALYMFYGDHVGPRIARKHIAWYCRHLPGAATLRDDINRTENPSDQVSRVLAFFNHCPDTETRAA